MELKEKKISSEEIYKGKIIDVYRDKVLCPNGKESYREYIKHCRASCIIAKLPNNREKGKIYEELFPTNRGETDLQQVEKLLSYFKKSKKTNMDVFIKKCLDSL